jgi:hypothetical protein
MAATLVLVAICTVGVTFLLYVLVALSRETRLQPVPTTESKLRTRIVVLLPPDPIITIRQNRPADVPENAPFLIVSNSGKPPVELSVDEQTAVPSPLGKRTHARVAN